MEPFLIFLLAVQVFCVFMAFRTLWVYFKRQGIMNRVHKYNLDQIVNGSTNKILDYDLGLDFYDTVLKFWVWDMKKLVTTPYHPFV